MNGYRKITIQQTSLRRRGLYALLLCLLLSGVAQPTMAVASKAQAATTSNAVISVTDSKPPAEANRAQSSEENSEPDAGTLALLALGLIALGLTRRKVRN